METIVGRKDDHERNDGLASMMTERTLLPMSSVWTAIQQASEHPFEIQIESELLSDDTSVICNSIW